jgi:hypothetical protein
LLDCMTDQPIDLPIAKGMSGAVSARRIGRRRQSAGSPQWHSNRAQVRA